MSEAADVVIIGSGFAGAATAYHLAERGAGRIVVLEAEARAGVHASGKNAALCYQLIENEAEARLAIEGTRIYGAPPAALAARPLVSRQGSLVIATEARRAALEESERLARRLGVAARLLDRDEAIRRVPLLVASDFALVLENPEDGVVDIGALLEGYLSAARRRGADVRFAEPVRAVGVSRGRVESVTTARGTLATRSVVNAAGPWAGEIGRLAGAALTMEPRRRHIFQLTVGTPIDPSWPFVWHSDVDAYFRPEKGGVIASACDATVHPPREPVVDPAAGGALRAALARAFPGLAPLELAEGRACLRTFSANERFRIGRDPEVEGFSWVAALGGHGMSTSYAAGRLGASAVLGETSAELARFAVRP